MRWDDAEAQVHEEADDDEGHTRVSSDEHWMLVVANLVNR